MRRVFEDNLKLNAAEAGRGALVLKSRPVSLAFTATTACNLGCIMCSRAQRPGELSASAARKLASLFPYLQDLNVQGGEPLLASWLDAFLEEAAGFAHIRKYVTTNGLLIDAERAELFSRAEVFLIWSIDSPRPDVYEHIRRGARHSDLLRALSAVKAANAKTGKSPRKEINAVVMRSNAGHLDEFLPFALEHGFSVINLAPILFNEGSKEDIFSGGSADELLYLRRSIQDLSRSAAKAGVRVQSSVPGTAFAPQEQACREPQAPAGEKKPICLMPWRQLFVDLSRENGPAPKNVFPECFCLQPLGNIETDEVEELWNGAAMQEYRRRVHGGQVRGFCHSVCLSKLPRERFT